MARAQQAVSTIERARLFENTPTTTHVAVNADGTQLGDTDTSSDDDSFGTQVILKSKERVRMFAVTGDTSVFYTNNAALTRNREIHDVFFVANAGVSWTPRINPQLEAQVAAHASIFRYHDTSALDFESLGLGAGLFWNPENFYGVSIFARYDFIELLDRHSDEILNDHEFTIGAQKTYSFGRCQSLTVGATAIAGISDPDTAQRQQLGVFFSYHLQLTRALESEIFYRLAFQFYNAAERNDFNQVISLTLRYRLATWADLNAFFSYGNNRSDVAAFEYGAVTGGAGVGVTMRF
ncbi:MAG: hypothetical protein QOH88_524 [Verrucomicrobiota bacterium]